MARHLKKIKSPRVLHLIDVQQADHPYTGRSRRGSIEQHLDMIESGPLRGDEILHHHGIPERLDPRPPLDDRLLEENYHPDMSEESREGDEESGDEHSSGLQGSDQQELQYDRDSPGDADSGAPGEMTEMLAHADPTKLSYRRVP
jgi:hypothetical protein